MSSTESDPLYHQDFYTWAMHTAELIRRQQFDRIDTQHLAEAGH